MTTDDARTDEPKVVTIRTAIKEAFNLLHFRYEYLQQNRSDDRFISTGFKEYDRLASGLQPGELTIFAGRPCMGCMALALNIATNVALRSAKQVLIVSMSRPARELVLHLIALTGSISRNRLTTAGLDEDEWHRLTETINRLTGVAIQFLDDPLLSCEELLQHARDVREEGELGLIVVSRFHQLRTGRFNRSSTGRNLEIASTLKALARASAAPVIALAQVSESVEMRADKRPSLYDLREYEAIVQYADTIACLYRDDYYSVDSGQAGVAEIIVERTRSGVEGVAKLYFASEHMKFDSEPR